MFVPLRRWSLGCLGLLLAGCVAIPHPEPSPLPTNPKASATFPARIAVLPVSNKAGGSDGAVILRAFVARKLSRDLGFLVQKTDQTDEILNGRNLNTDIPIQVFLARSDPKDIAAWLGVDGLLHGEVLNYAKAKLSIYVQSDVKARFWLTDITGKKIWAGEQDSGSSGFGSGSVSVDSFLTDSDLSPELREKIHNSDLSMPAFYLVDTVFSSFPKRD